MREIAVVAAAQRQVRALTTDTELELMAPVMNEVRQRAGLTQADIGFTCSGSSDFLAGQAFSFVMTLDAVGAFPPIHESHVEMDGAWALYEAWVKMQMGEIDTALVYSYGKSSPGSLRDVLSLQLDPYYLAPLWPDAHAVAALQARLLLEGGHVTEEQLGEIAARALRNGASYEHATRSDAGADAASARSGAVISDPLTEGDLAAESDGGIAVILAAGDRARDITDRPAWIRGFDHRTDTHQLGARDLTSAPSARIAAEKAGVAGTTPDVAELDSPYTTQEHLLIEAIGLGDGTTINPSGGSLAGRTLMASGLMRIAAAAQTIWAGDAGRAMAHATSGPCLQQNLICVLEGD